MTIEGQVSTCGCRSRQQDRSRCSLPPWGLDRVKLDCKQGGARGVQGGRTSKAVVMGQRMRSRQITVLGMRINGQMLWQTIQARPGNPRANTSKQLGGVLPACMLCGMVDTRTSRLCYELCLLFWPCMATSLQEISLTGAHATATAATVTRSFIPALTPHTPNCPYWIDPTLVPSP